MSVRRLCAAVVACLFATSANACLITWSERPPGLNFAQHYMRNTCDGTVKIFWDTGAISFLARGETTRYYGSYTYVIYD